MIELTKRELNILEILWELKRGFVNDIIEKIEDPKPPYTTISSIIRILETRVMSLIKHMAILMNIDQSYLNSSIKNLR